MASPAWSGVQRYRPRFPAKVRGIGAEVWVLASLQPHQLSWASPSSPPSSAAMLEINKYGVTRWSESRVVRNIDCTFRTWSRFGEGLGVRTRDEAQRLASIRVGVMRSETNSTTPKNALLYFAGEIVPSVQAVDGKRRT